MFRFFVFLFSFLILVDFSIDPDLGWHLRLGNDFFRDFIVVSQDKYSFTMQGYDWGNSYFLYQLLVSFLFKNFGLLGTGVFFGILSAMGLFVLFPKKIKPLYFLLVVPLSCAILVTNLGIKPHVISFLFFAILVKFIFSNKLKFSKFSGFFWFLFFLIWANSHNGFIVGLGILGGYVFLESIQRKKAVHLDILGISLLGSLITPFGLRLFGSIANDALFYQMWNSVAEWQPPILFFPLNLLFLASGSIFIYTIFANSKRLEPKLTLVCSSMFMLSTLAVYFLYFWIPLFVYFATKYLDLKFNFRWLKFYSYLLFLLITGSVITNYFVKVAESSSLNFRFKRDKYPYSAVNFMKASNFGGNVFAKYEWAGFLLWQNEGAKVFIDGRMTGWEDDRGRIFLRYLEVLNGNCKSLGEYEIDYVLVNLNFDSKCFAQYRVVYEDEVSKVLAKASDIQI